MPAGDETLTVAAGSASPAEPPLAAGTVLADRYEILDLLGAGGFGVVYRVRDRALGREVALKMLRVERAGEDALRRFRREAALARDVADPHVVRIFDLGTVGDRFFLTLEHLAGGSLKDRLRIGPIPVEETLRIAAEVLRGLAALHARGIVHRDVKPGNILFDEAGDAKLADFGLALPLDRDETRTLAIGSLLGTAEYLSPEQALAKPADPRSDLFAVGVVLFEMLTGELPYPSASTIESLLLRVSRPARRLRDLRAEIPRWLERLVGRLLERDPEQRYSSAAEVLADLGRRRARLGRRAWRRILALAAAVGALGLGLWWLEVRRSVPRFVALRPIGIETELGIEAVDAQGRPLWRKPNASIRVATVQALARLERGAPRRLLVFLGREDQLRPEQYGSLAVLDPESGAELRRLDLRLRTSDPFPGTPDRFHPAGLAAVDLDGDGLDEVIASYTHVPGWASFATLYEPALDRTRTVAALAGHHVFALARDLDGDGRSELLFTGINSVLGRYPSVAAVRVEPWVGTEPAATPNRLGPAMGPGLGHFVLTRGRLAWSRLLPRGDLFHGPGALVIDTASDVLNARYQDRTPVSLAPESELFAAQGQESARAARLGDAFAAIEETQRLAQLASWPGALAEAERAATLARELADPMLEESAERFRARWLVGAGRVQEGEQTFRQLAADSTGGSEIRFDAARALHLAGALEHAIGWYREGLGSGGGESGGRRSALSFLEGFVFALGERGRWREALEEIERFAAATNGTGPLIDGYRSFTRARLGLPVGEDREPAQRTSADAVRYLILERSRLQGAQPEPLLLAIREEIELGVETEGPLLSLEAEVLSILGRQDEAKRAAAEAVVETAAWSSRSVLARGLQSLVRERRSKLG